MKMLKLLKKLLGFKTSDNIGGLGLEIRELIKGKEIDPQKLIELQAQINEQEAKHRTIFVAGCDLLSVGFVDLHLHIILY